MPKKIEFFDGKPVFEAKNSKELAEAVAKYKSDVQAPYVVRVPSSVKKIKEEAFKEDQTVGILLLPDSIKEIEGWAFMCCDNLSRIYFPDSITTIGPCAFYGCESLQSVTVPDSVTEIGSCAFAHCISLKTAKLQARTTRDMDTKEDRREALHLYCQQDTWAMVEILRAIRSKIKSRRRISKACQIQKMSKKSSTFAPKFTKN